MRGRLLAGLMLVALAAAAPAAAPSASRPITADAYAAIDVDSGRLLIGKNPNQRRPIASLTKIMTALLVIEAGDLASRVVTPVLATRVEPTKEGLVAGKRYKRSTLLWSTLLESANDSATTLGWDAGNRSLKRFYARMNERARQLGLARTTYASASGLEDVANQSTALDQARLARIALRNPMFATMVSTKRRFQRWAAPTHLKEWVNHNRMLQTHPGTYGVKTGFTTRAGGCLAVAVQRGGRAVVVVLLGSDTIWEDAPRLVERAFRALARG